MTQIEVVNKNINSSTQVRNESVRENSEKVNDMDRQNNEWGFMKNQECGGEINREIGNDKKDREAAQDSSTNTQGTNFMVTPCVK